jgi:hypothetical protein
MPTPRSSRSGRARSSPEASALVTIPKGAKPDDKRRLIIAAIKATGIPPRQAALSVGVSSSAYYRLVEDPAFMAEIDAATALFGRRMGAVIARAAAGMGSWRAAAFWLERRWVDSYGPRLDLHVEDEAPSPEDRLAELTPEVLEAEFQKLALEALSRLPAEKFEAAVERARERRSRRP